MKREILRQTLAKELLALSLGEQIPTIRYFADLHKSSVGTIQSILAEFEESGAVEIERRGWMGTYLHSKNLGQLWSIARNGNPLVIAFPLPSTRICEGLATGVKELLSQNQIETFLIFLRGSRNRLQALRQGRCHAIVVSSFTAHEMCSPGERIVLELPPKTYVQEHRVFYSDDPAKWGNRRLRVAMDRSSTDIQRLTELEFEGEAVDYIPTTYMRYAQMLKQRQVDALIWDIDETHIRLGSEAPSRPLSDRVLNKIKGKNTQASFIAASDDLTTPAILLGSLKIDELLRIQKAVMDGKRVPEY